MSSSKPKKVVHYERGTKAPSHRHHNSRDSGVGSSSSDRATVHDDEEIHHQQDFEKQPQNLRVVQEALSAAKEHIKHLEATIKTLNADLGDSNKENRTLKKEKSGLLRDNQDLVKEKDGLLSENQDLVEVIEDLNLKLKKRESSPRSSMASAAATATAKKPERRPSMSTRQGPPSPRRQQSHPEEHDRPLPSHGEKRPSIRQSQTQGPLPSPRLQVYTDPQLERRLSSSMYDRTAPLPSAPQPPVNHHPNPFTPRSVNSPMVTYAAIPANVSYAPSAASYVSQQPLYVSASHGSVSGSSSSSKRERKEKRGEFDDGKYHLKPL